MGEQNTILPSDAATPLLTGDEGDESKNEQVIPIKDKISFLIGLPEEVLRMILEYSDSPLRSAVLLFSLSRTVTPDPNLIHWMKLESGRLQLQAIELNNQRKRTTPAIYSPETCTPEETGRWRSENHPILSGIQKLRVAQAIIVSITLIITVSQWVPERNNKFMDCMEELWREHCATRLGQPHTVVTTLLCDPNQKAGESIDWHKHLINRQGESGGTHAVGEQLFNYACIKYAKPPIWINPGLDFIIAGIVTFLALVTFKVVIRSKHLDNLIETIRRQLTLPVGDN